MDGLLVLLNEAGLAIQQLKAAVAQRDQRIKELEAQVAPATKAGQS